MTAAEHLVAGHRGNAQMNPFKSDFRNTDRIPCGAARSSAEVAVMAIERRGCVPAASSNGSV
jgi:hypothetical protein